MVTKFTARNLIVGIIQKILSRQDNYVEMYNFEVHFENTNLNERSHCVGVHLINNLEIDQISNLLVSVKTSTQEWFHSSYSNIFLLIKNILTIYQTTHCYLNILLTERFIEEVVTHKYAFEIMTELLMIEHKINDYPPYITIRCDNEMNIMYNQTLIFGGIIYMYEKNHTPSPMCVVTNSISYEHYDGNEIRTQESIVHTEPEAMYERSVGSTSCHSINKETEDEIYNFDLEIEDTDLKLHGYQPLLEAKEGLNMFHRWGFGDQTIVVSSYNTSEHPMLEKSVTEQNPLATSGILFCATTPNIDDSHFRWCQIVEDISTTEEGLVMCPFCHTTYIIDASGPHKGLTDDCLVCGFEIATGDHMYNQNLIVISRGNKWYSKRSNVGFGWLYKHQVHSIIDAGLRS